MTNIIIPSSPADRKRIKDCMDEISLSFLRQEAEKDFVKEALISLEDEVGVPKKYLKKMAKIHHKQNMAEVVNEFSDISELYDIVMCAERNDEQE
jgi:hypothetical protein